MMKEPRSRAVTKTTARSSRPPLLRMMRLHDALRSGGFPNCSSLARQFEVSYKTVQRDIDFMRDQLGLPIEYDASRQGFFYTEEVTEFPSVQVSEGELIALFVAQKSLAQYQGTSFEKPLAAAFRKLTEGLRDEVTVALRDWDAVFSFKALGPPVTDVRMFESITRAIRNRRELHFSYRKLNSRGWDPRRCHPYHLSCVDGQWYLFGWDLERQDIRTFVLTRLRDLVVTDTPFEKPRHFSAKNYLRKSFGIFSGEQMREVVVLFDAFAAQLIRERRWHASQKIRELPDGGVELSLQLGSLPEVERWILSWGDHAKVVAPPELVESITRIATALHHSYQQPTPPTKKNTPSSSSLMGGAK